jgi:hypothetical protein
MPLGKVYGSEYYYASCNVEQYEWCRTHFGEPSKVSTDVNGRWYLYDPSLINESKFFSPYHTVWFRDEKDYMLWVLKWD